MASLGQATQPFTSSNATSKAPHKQAATKPPKRRTEAVPAAPVQASGNLAVVIAYALSQVGDGYRRGATGPDLWDCSALTMKAYAQIGVRLPHQSGAQMRYGRPVVRAQLQPGDLVFWKGHVALSLGGNRIVHATNPRTGVKVATIYGSPIGFRRLVG